MDSRHRYVQVGRCSHLQRARGDQALLTPPGPPAPTRESPPSGTARGLGQGTRGTVTPASHEPPGCVTRAALRLATRKSRGSPPYHHRTGVRLTGVGGMGGSRELG